MPVCLATLRKGKKKGEKNRNERKKGVVFVKQVFFFFSLLEKFIVTLKKEKKKKASEQKSSKRIMLSFKRPFSNSRILQKLGKQLVERSLFDDREGAFAVLVDVKELVQ